MRVFARRRSRRDFDVFFLGTATAAQYSQRSLLEQLPQRIPARIGLGRGAVVLAAGLEPHAAAGAQAGAVGAAQDLAREREDERVAHPAVDVELVVGQVLAAELVVVGVGAVLLVLRRAHRDR